MGLQLGPQHCRDITIQWPEMTPKRLTVSKRTVSSVVALEAWPVFWITKVAIINGKVRSTFNLFFSFLVFLFMFFLFFFYGFFFNSFFFLLCQLFKKKLDMGQASGLIGYRPPHSYRCVWGGCFPTCLTWCKALVVCIYL